jgi:DNA-directed RNA polymerase specialized sigma24 family protein
VKQIEPWVNQSAVSTGRAYSTWTSVLDVRQHLWSWAYQNQDRISDYLNQEDGERIVRSILNQEARNYAVKERAAVSGYNPEDVAWYTVTAIKRTLPDVFDYNDWQSFQAGNGGPSNQPAAWSGDRLATIIDISKAVDSLPADRREFLKIIYGDGAGVEAAAAAQGITLEAAHKRHQRALKTLSRALNDPRPVDPMEGATYEQWKANQHFYDTRSKGRKAISNAAARAATEI